MSFDPYSDKKEYELHPEYRETCEERVESLTEDVEYPGGDYIVYTLELTRYDDEVFYYVGVSENVYERLESHLGNGNSIVMPTPEGRLGRPDYEVTTVLEMISGGNSRDIARERERRKAYEVALEYETTNVLGGQ